MDSSALNLAHQQHRRAEAHLRYRRFDEAIECHQQAADKLEEAMKLTNVNRALESLKLQQDYHVRQLNIVRLKQAQFKLYRAAMENQRVKMATVLAKKEPASVRDSDSTNLQVAIYRTMEEADSLLALLECPSEPPEDPPLQGDLPEKDVCGHKRPKDTTVVIEELHTLNAQLRALVARLMSQLIAAREEADALRARLRSETQSPPLPTQPSPEPPRTSLPPLAPLEMPSFDFSVLLHQSEEQ